MSSQPKSADSSPAWKKSATKMIYLATIVALVIVIYILAKPKENMSVYTSGADIRMLSEPSMPSMGEYDQVKRFKESRL